MDVPLDVLKIISSYITKHKMKLLDWINIENIPNMSYLSTNPNAIDFLEANLDKIKWDWLSLNPNAIHLLEANFDKIDWELLSRNKNAIH